MGPALGEGLTGEGIIVTGASGGIGREIAIGMADAGARVCVIDLPGRDVHGVARSLPGRDDHIGRELDLRHTAAIEPTITSVTQELGSVWALVHAAAFLKREAPAAVTEDSWDAQIDVNLKATFWLNRTVGEKLVAQGRGGRIINFTSAAWLIGPMIDSDVYAASKGGIVTMTRGFARRLGPQRITVNSISPGQIATPLQSQESTAEAMDAVAASCPLGRMGSPSEVAAVAIFLASSHASFISGATLNVSGGLVMY
jgi:NAD(P)-dependent dehydrogenase (short-subunit alcohol dehydrogenase family)